MEQKIQEKAVLTSMEIKILLTGKGFFNYYFFEDKREEPKEYEILNYINTMNKKQIIKATGQEFCILEPYKSIVNTIGTAFCVANFISRKCYGECCIYQSDKGIVICEKSGYIKGAYTFQYYDNKKISDREEIGKKIISQLTEMKYLPDMDEIEEINGEMFDGSIYIDIEDAGIKHECDIGKLIEDNSSIQTVTIVRNIQQETVKHIILSQEKLLYTLYVYSKEEYRKEPYREETVIKELLWNDGGERIDYC